MSRLGRGVRRAFNAAGLEVTRKAPSGPAAAPPQQGPQFRRGSAGPDLVDRAEYEALRQVYAEHPLARVSGRIWAEGDRPGVALQDIDVTTFRADNAFVWQGRLHTLGDFALAALWAARQDTGKLLQRLDESGEYGVDMFNVADRQWSRDLIDSVLEITFLREHLPADFLDTEPVVDIGAGYGRLVTRLAAVTTNDRIVACDGVALSTLICRGYVEHLNLQDRVEVVALPDVDGLAGFGLATNVHSFSEMSPEAVSWWLTWLRERQVRFLFIVPNRSTNREPALNSGQSIVPLLTDHGYSLVTHRRKYTDPVVDSAAAYADDYYLYEWNRYALTDS